MSTKQQPGRPSWVLPAGAPYDLDYFLEWSERELPGDARESVTGLVRETAVLRAACATALAWVENMKIVPGGERDRLRVQLRLALGKDPQP